MKYLRVRRDHLVRVGHDPDAVAEQEHKHDVDGDPGEGYFTPAKHGRFVRLAGRFLKGYVIN